MIKMSTKNKTKPRAGKVKTRREEILKDYVKYCVPGNMTRVELAAMYGCSHITIRVMAIEAGVYVKEQGGRTKTEYRAELVAEMKARIASGTYEFNAEHIAYALMPFFLRHIR